MSDELDNLLAGARLLKLSPGDTLVIELPGHPGITARDAEEIRERAADYLPGNKVVVLQAGEARVEKSYDLLVELGKLSDAECVEIGRRMSQAINRYRRHRGMRPT